MLRQWWWRLPLTGGHLWMVAGLTFAVIAAVGFVNLYQVRAESLAAYARAQAQVQQLQEQHDLLQTALDQAQRGDNVDPQARRFFKYSRPGEKRLVVESPPPPAPVSPSNPQSSPPYWRQWLDRLTGR